MKPQGLNRHTKEEALVLTSPASMSNVMDRMLVFIIASGCLAFLSVVWMHMTPPAHLVAVQTLQALASLGTIASIGWTLFRGNNSIATSTAASAKTAKCLFVMLAGGMLIGSLNPAVSDILNFLSSIPSALKLKQSCPSLVPVREEVPTSEDYLIGRMYK